MKGDNETVRPVIVAMNVGGAGIVRPPVDRAGAMRLVAPLTAIGRLSELG